ncbi:hypothetical protein ACQEVZ_55565 [Dactylosporangium sp. CA-152071]|uniref:hypothetical protein n=1 Tax=Dactylosporangium sp. CA-152071 TaxID=3239933 RepID=UPI003D93E744
MNSPSHLTTLDGDVHVVDYFDVYRCEPEATYPIPAVRDGDPVLEIRIVAAGGGKIGAVYPDNGWIYGVWLDGALVCSGADLRSGGIAHTHRQMAAILADYLTDDAPALLRGQGDRLSQWSDDERRGTEGGSDV